MNLRQLKSSASSLGHERFPDGQQLVEPLWGGSLYLNESSIVGNTVRASLRWANMSGGNVNGKVCYFGMRGVRGRTLEFHFDEWTAEAGTLSNKNEQYPSWSYDRVTWTPFNNRSTSTGLLVWNNFPFTKDVVYVSMFYPVDFREYMNWVKTQVIPNPLVSAPPVSRTGYPYELSMRQPARTSLDRSVGRARPEYPIYAFRIGTGSKLCFITCDIHTGGEARARTAFRGSVNFLLSSDAKAIALRAACTFIICPSLNPVGSLCGSSRGVGEDMTVDPNRQYQTTSPAAYQEAFKTAFLSTITALGLGAPRFCVDFHQHQGGGPFLLYPVHADNTTFANRVVGYNSNFGKNNIQAYVADQGTSINFWHQTVGAFVTMIHETKNSETIANCTTYGTNLMKALADSIAANEI